MNKENVIGLIFLVSGIFLFSSCASVEFERGYEAYQNQDYKTAYQNYRKAADKGEPVAQNNLGLMYEKGEWVSQDYIEAARLYEKAAMQGNAHGQYNLGRMYEQDLGGVRRDLTEAVRWYQKSAEQGHSKAQYNLGHMYANGMGVQINYSKAREYFQNAANGGLPEAKIALKSLDDLGKGQPPALAPSNLIDPVIDDNSSTKSNSFSSNSDHQSNIQDGSTEYSIFHDQGDDFEEFMENSNYEKAAKLYNEHHETYFKKRGLFNDQTYKEKYSSQLKLLAEKLNENFKSRINDLTNKLKEHTQWPVQRGAWATIKSDFASAQSLIGEYNQYMLLNEPDYREEKMVEVEQLLSDLINKANSFKDESFVQYDLLNDENFFEAYPSKENEPKHFLEKNISIIQSKLAKASINQLTSFAETYNIEENLKAAIGELYFKRFLAENFGQNHSKDYDFEEIIKAVKATKETGFDLKGIPDLKIVFIDATSKILISEGKIDFPPEVEVDFPFPTEKKELEESLSRNYDAKFLIIFDVAQASIKRRIKNREKVSSSFLAGYRDIPNPAYNEALLKVQDRQTAMISNSSNPCYNDAYGLCSLGKGIAAIGIRSQLNEAQQLLANTPQYIKEPVKQEYQVSVSSLEASKLLTVNYYIIDLKKKGYFKSIFDVSENKHFQLLYQLDDRDTNKDSLVSRYDSEETVSAFEKRPVSVKLSALLNHYLEKGSELRPYETEEKLRQAMLKDRNKIIQEENQILVSQSPKNDERFESVVVIYNPNGAIGAGFYVKPNYVLTNYHVVEGSKFAELKLFNGLETFGKVVKSDVRLDLALLKVEMQGRPVEFYNSSEPALGKMVEAIGHPSGLEFTITRGIISALRKRQSVYSTGGMEILFIQTDTAISPGNSGGPLFLGNKVIGINDWKIIKEGMEGLNFSIHVSEAMKFLREDY